MRYAVWGLRCCRGSRSQPRGRSKCDDFDDEYRRAWLVSDLSCTKIFWMAGFPVDEPGVLLRSAPLVAKKNSAHFARNKAWSDYAALTYAPKGGEIVMTSNFETQNALTVQDHYQPPAVDSFDYDEPGASPIRGGNAKFDAGAFFVGKEKTLLAPERRFIVLDKAAGWVFLKAGCPAEYLMQSPGQPQPERPECGEEADWPLDLE